jgi:hypothetical protein
VEGKLLVSLWNKKNRDLEYQISTDESVMKWEEVRDIREKIMDDPIKFSSVKLQSGDVMLLCQFYSSPSCLLYRFVAKYMKWVREGNEFFDVRYKDVSLIEMREDYVVGAIRDSREIVLYNASTRIESVFAEGKYLESLDMIHLGKRSLGVVAMDLKGEMWYGYCENLDDVKKIELRSLNIRGTIEHGFYDGIAINVFGDDYPCVATSVLNKMTQKYEILFLSAKDSKGDEWNECVVVKSTDRKISSLTLLYLRESKFPYVTYVNDKDKNLYVLYGQDMNKQWNNEFLLLNVKDPNTGNIIVQQGENGVGIIHQDMESNKLYYNFMPTVDAEFVWRNVKRQH